MSPAIPDVRPSGPVRLVLPISLLLCACALYNFDLGTDTIVRADEGANLYAAWRVSTGERLYRDVRFGQAPLPAQLGAALFRRTGPDALAAKRMSVAFSLLGAFFAYLLAEAAFGRGAAVLALALLLTDGCWHSMSWRFTPETYVLCFYLASLYFFARAFLAQQNRILWFVAGLLGGLSACAGLIGAFALGGAAIFGCYQLARPAGLVRSRLQLLDGLLLFAAGAATAALLFVAPLAGSLDRFVVSNVRALLRAFHEYPVDELPAGLFRDPFSGASHPAHVALVMLGLLGLLSRPGKPDSLRTLLVCHVTQALVFLGMAFDTQARQLVFVLPILAIFAAEQLAAMTRDPGEMRSLGKAAAVAMLGLAIFDFRATAPHDGRAELTRLVKAAAAGDARIVADDLGLAFLAARKALAPPEPPTGGKLPIGPMLKFLERERPPVVVLRKLGGSWEAPRILESVDDPGGLLRHLGSKYRPIAGPGSAFDGSEVYVSAASSIPSSFKLTTEVAPTTR
ncbi:MAG: glycosyltransferase family 39 protein [Candidatus Wallbacteria bacterium]|nr:glycosyltransferase family 39 protein [Candidatus Wallbacteria bacterium]